MKQAALFGLLIWFGATVGLRLAGHHVFADTSSTRAIVLLAVSLPLMALIAYIVLIRQQHRALAAIALVTPGMLLDAGSAIWFEQVFPNIRPDAAGLFGGWLLFCNAVVLATALALQARQSPVHSSGSSR